MKRKSATFLLMVGVYSLFMTIPTANAAEKIFKLLTLNLLFSEPTTSPSVGGVARFDSIAKFILEKNIDCVLCQEVVGGKIAEELGWIEMQNSSLELKSKLGDDYELRYRLANGVPFVLSVGNAIFCKKPIKIKWTVAKTLPFAYEITIGEIDIKLRRKIMVCLLEVPDFGRLLLFNVHFCAACPTDQRQAQINKALKFIKWVQWFVRLFYGNVPSVFGGDFNIPDIKKSSPDAAADEYHLITGAGFIDAYAATQKCVFQTDCCIPETNPLTVEPGCTFAVDKNHFEHNPQKTSRIDYFFLQELTADSADVVFNKQLGPFVSDHSGLVVEMSPWD
jgi:maltose 6'-phosphate phosphatase